jgi:hypothetical protein
MVKFYCGWSWKDYKTEKNKKIKNSLMPLLLQQTRGKYIYSDLHECTIIYYNIRILIFSNWPSWLYGFLKLKDMYF